MRTSWHDIWGSANGPVKKLAPKARIICGACIFATCMITPAKDLQGVAAVTIMLMIWGVLVRPPAKIVRSSLILGLFLFLPYFLLTPLIRENDSTNSWLEAGMVPWVVFFRGMTAMQASVFTATTLCASGLRQGLSSLPIPSVFSAILIQIVHQTSNLIYETRSIAAAISVRGGTTGYRTAIRILGSIPNVWLPRVIEKAERVSLAMEMRGYCQRGLADMRSVSMSARDGWAIFGALLVLVSAVAFRNWGGG